MSDLTDSEIDAALECGRLARQAEPRAASARYDRESGSIIVELTNGCTFAFPPRIAQGLETATDDELATVEILGAGYGLHWEVLDADLSVAGLLAGRFGTKAFMDRRKNLLDVLNAMDPRGPEDQFPDIRDGLSD